MDVSLKKMEKNGICQIIIILIQKKKNNVNVDFFVIDTNTDNLNDKELRKQFNYITKKLKESKADWKIVYGRHTWSISLDMNAEDRLEKFLNRKHITLVHLIYICVVMTIINK